MIDKCTFNISELENNLHIQKNLTVSANGIFKSGIILGNSNINSTVTELGTIRYSGLDIEGYLDGTWKSLTSGGSGGGSSGSSKSNTFQLNNITQTATYLESIIGFSIENSTIVSQIYGNNYQIINSANSFDTLEINISHPNLSTNPLSYSLEIYIDNNLSQTINITIPQNSIETILRTITNLTVQPNNKLQLKIKALDSASEGGDIFISLHNINTTIPTPVENRITSGVINSDVFQLNSITQSYNNLETILGLSLHSTIISQAYIKDYQIITHPNIYNIIEVNISHSNLITNPLSYNLEIYINNSVAQTVNISIPQNSIQTILVSISELEVKQNDKLQLKIKANNVVSEGGNIFISLHGKNIITTTTTSIQDNFSIEHNLTVSGNGIFNNTINVGELAVSNKIGIGTSTVETSLDINSSLKVFDVLNDVSGYVNTSDGNYMKLQSTSRTDTNTKKNIVLNPDGGNVGIGNSTPNQTLQVGDNNSSGVIQVGANNYVNTWISPGNSTTPHIFTGSDHNSAMATTPDTATYGFGWEYSPTTGDYSLLRKNNSTSFNYILTAKRHNGYIGIGTNPGSVLHIAGIRDNNTVLEGIHFGKPSASNTDYGIEGVCGSTASGFYFDFKKTNTSTNDYDGRFYFHFGSLKFVFTRFCEAPSFNNTSDDRLKINETNIINALSVINKLSCEKYDKITEFRNKDIPNPETIKEAGFIAQEVKQIQELQDFVYEGDENNPWTINYDSIFTYAVKAIQELSSKNTELETKNTELETEVSTLKTQLADLLTRVSALENN